MPIKRRNPPKIDLEDTLAYIYHLKKQKDAIESELKILSDKFKEQTEPGFTVIVETEDGKKEARHEQSITPILTDDIKKAEKKLGKHFLNCVTLSVTKIRDLLGDSMVSCLKVDEKKTDSLKFYKVKE